MLFGRLIRKNSKEAQDHLAESKVVVEETLQGVASVKAFANEDYEEARYRTSLDRFLERVLRGAKYRGGFFSFIIFALFGALVLVMWYGCRLVQAGGMSLGDLASFMLYTMYAAGAMGSFADLYSQLQRALGATQRIRELLGEKTEEEIAGRAAGFAPAVWVEGETAGINPAARLRGDVVFDGVTFRYPSRPGAMEAEVVEAARKANAHDFITAFREGYRTRVGERGVQLSGGQRQRVAIARAILRDPAILILDEATSSLDSESESLVLQALDGLMQGRTSLIIAHRLSTVRSADRIFVLKDGATIEEGTHDELVARPEGLYRTLSMLQLDGAARSPEKEEESWSAA